MCVPRKTALPEREREICERLRLFRKLLRHSRVDFAREANLDSSLLASYEHKRSPLQYQAAKKILLAFNLNPEWLATGKGKPIVNDYVIPQLPDLEAHKLFSEVFDNYIQNRTIYVCQALELVLAGKPPFEGAIGIRERFTAREIIEFASYQWVQQVPDQDLVPFLLDIIKHAHNYIQTLPIEDPAVVRHRDEQFSTSIMSEGRYDEHVSLKTSKPKNDSEKKDQVSLDSTDDLIDKTPMADKKVSHWARLRARIMRATESYGSKAALSRELNVSRQAVDQWISGSTMPTGETALRLLSWVEQEEAKQKSSGSGDTQPEPKTRQEKSDESSKSSPKE